MRKFVRPAVIALFIAALSTQLGCAFGEFRPDDPFKRQYELELAQKRYSDLVRWSKFEEAAQFMAPDARRDFRDKMPDFKEVRFTDHSTAPWELDELKTEAEIHVTYTGYSMRVPIEIEVHEVQKWTREGKSNDWKVSSEFTDLDRLAVNR